MEQRDLPPTVLSCEVDARCDCEAPGYYCCGVPGVLAVIENGKVAPGAVVERCDACERFASDEAARQKLVSLGMMEDDPRQPTFTVYAYAIVQTKHEGVAAASARDAAKAVSDRFSWDRLQGRAVFAEEFDRFIVETEGD
ncbi:MAG: hypothetical protein H0T51_06420, partial [Pirellulales bacterium]|nr:hypothetical protein [Pirellulales bacterium]